MKFSVVGASGYLGGRCYAYLKSKEHEVVGTQFRSHSPDLITFDLAQDSISAAGGLSFGPSFVTGEEKTFCIIFAAFSQVERCFQEKKESYQVNVEGTIRLLKDLAQRGVVPVYISSSAVYEGSTGNYDEESPRSPLTEYGRQKLLVEKFIEGNLPLALIIRIDKMVGDLPAKRNFLQEWYTLIKQKKPIPCLEQKFSPTYVDDLAPTIELLCEKNLQGSYNVANTEIFSREELVRQFALTLDEECLIQRVSEKELQFQEPRPAQSSLNPRKFIKATQFTFTPMQEVFSRFKKNFTNSLNSLAFPDFSHFPDHIDSEKIRHG